MGSNPTLSARALSIESATHTLHLLTFNRDVDNLYTLKSTRNPKFRFKKFKVYQDAKEFCKFCRNIVERQIGGTDKGLASQIQGALNSIVLNIAEGSADNSDVEFARFLGISIRSVYESVAGFDLAFSYDLITENLNEEIEDSAHQLVKQLSGFRNSLRTTSAKG